MSPRAAVARQCGGAKREGGRGGSPAGPDGRTRDIGWRGGGGKGMAGSRLEIHLQYRPRLFSCLITPCRLKLNNKIYVVAERAVVNFYVPFPRIRHIHPFLRLFRDCPCLAGWPPRSFRYYIPRDFIR